MTDDAELLQRYVNDGSEAAFAELVRRNVDLVYGTALRHVGDAHRAKDVVQSVFIDLARKASSLRGHPALVSWLYTSTRYAALKTIRSEQRRHVREQEAQAMQTIYASDPAPEWERMRPVLDDVMDQLGERDRDLLLLRYFRGLTFAELAGSLRANEGAVRMRVDRALDRMNGLLSQRGIKSTATALGVALGSQLASAAPAGLAASVSGVALSAAVGSAAAGSIFLMSKLNIAIVSLVVAGGIATAVIEHNRTTRTEATLAELAKNRDAQDRKISDLTRLIAEAKEREDALLSALPPPSRVQQTPPPAAPQRQEPPPPAPGVSRTAPAGWSKNGSKVDAYVVGVDRNETWAGLPSAYVENVDSSNTNEFGGMMQMNSAQEFLGKRVRLSGWAKTEDAIDKGGHLWLRVDGPQRGVSLQFDNMGRNPIKGTTGWQQYSVVLDVPEEATALAYGFFVQGRGKMWVSGTKIEPVGPEVPSTNMIIDRTPTLPKSPVNLNFDPDRPK